MQTGIGRYGYCGGNTAGIRVHIQDTPQVENFRVQACYYIQACIRDNDVDEAFDYITTSIFFKDKEDNERHQIYLIEMFLPWVLK
jgi:hypothetical protein